MRPEYVTNQAVQAFISAAINEDVGEGDHSTLSSVPASAQGKARIIAKDEGLLAGIELGCCIFSYIDPHLNLQSYRQDGDYIKEGDVILDIEGKAQSILTAERLALNCIQRMSGIATKTKNMVEMIAGTRTKLLDTRKTTPNFRIAEKWAVRIGGGTNHRFGLYDLIMLKDNHIDFAGGIKSAIENAHKYLKKNNKHLKVEIETNSVDQVNEVLATGGVDIIMLDNMSEELLKECVHLINGKYLTEASGGITEKTIRTMAETGVDFISVGALTHSYRSLDLSLKAVR